MSSEVIVAFITGVLGPVALLYAKSKLEKKKPDIIKESLEVGELITSKLEEIRDEINCDRVWIAQFHNVGNFYPTGKSIAKFSMIYEVVGSNIDSAQSILQNVPVNLFNRSLSHLFDNNTLSVPDFTDDTIATYGLKNLSENMSAKSTYLFAIKNIEDKFVGILGMDFTKTKTVLDENVINSLLLRSTSIGGVLEKSIKK